MRAHKDRRDAWQETAKAPCRMLNTHPQKRPLLDGERRCKLCVAHYMEQPAYGRGSALWRFARVVHSSSRRARYNQAGMGGVRSECSGRLPGSGAQTGVRNM